jgi:hypothetical protein
VISSQDFNPKSGYEAGAASTHTALGGAIGMKMMSDSKYFEAEHEVLPAHAMQAYGGSRRIPPPIPNLSTGWR